MILFDILITAVILALMFLGTLEIFEWAMRKIERRMERERRRQHYEF